MEVYTFRTSKDLVSEKKWLNIIIQQNDTKMFNFDDALKKT